MMEVSTRDFTNQIKIDIYKYVQSDFKFLFNVFMGDIILVFLINYHCMINDIFVLFAYWIL